MYCLRVYVISIWESCSGRPGLCLGSCGFRSGIRHICYVLYPVFSAWQVCALITVYTSSFDCSYKRLVFLRYNVGVQDNCIIGKWIVWIGL